jgi:hypothetical protein
MVELNKFITKYIIKKQYIKMLKNKTCCEIK